MHSRSDSARRPRHGRPRWPAVAAGGAWLLSVLLALSAPTVGSALPYALQGRPLAVEYRFEGVPLVNLADVGRSAFYVAGRRDIRLVGPLAAIQEGDRVELSCWTTDGRRARLSLEPASEGALRVRFQVEGLRSSERLGASLHVAPDEAFYGLMERVRQGLFHEHWPPRSGGLDLRGQEVWLYTLPTMSLYSPFFVSSAGYGVHVQSDWPGIYRFGRDARGRETPTQVTIEQEGPELVLLFVPGPTPLEAVERYARSVGTTVLPPRWTFLPWRWRDDLWDLPAFYDGTPNPTPFNSMVVEDVVMMEALGIPCGVYIIDRPWAGGPMGYGDLAFDPARLPNAPEMIAWLEEKGIKTVLWAAPWVMNPVRREARALGFTVRGAVPFLPSASLIDFTDPRAVLWWQDQLLPRIEDGIVGLKLDRADEKVPDGRIFRGSYADGTSYREGHNAYPAWFAEAAAGAFKRAGVDEHVLLVRAGWTGSSQHAIAWGGDSATSQWGLRTAIIGVQRAAAINFPIWGSDTGGYAGRAPREVVARWLAFSAFTPLFEVGPTANLAFWSWAPDGVPARVDGRGYHFEPLYDEELVAIWHLYAALRKDMLDYVYALARRAHDVGTPMVRPMAFVHPEQLEYRDLWEQYFFGSDLLVRPVWREGDREAVVHIPPGRWTCTWTGQTVEGPIRVIVDAPLHRIPLFVREGSMLDLGDLEARWVAARAATEEPPDLAAILSSW